MESPNAQGRRIQYPECTLRGLHEGENMNLVVLEPGYRQNLLACHECITQNHQNHRYQSIKTLINDIEYDVIHQSGFDDPAKLNAAIDETEATTVANLDQIQKEFLERTNSFRKQACDLFNLMRDEVSKYSQNKQSVNDLFTKIYSTKHTQETLTENLIQILDLQDYQTQKENENVTPTTSNAYNKISKVHQQIATHLKAYREDLNSRLDHSILKISEYSVKNSSLVVKDDPFVFEAGEQSQFSGPCQQLTEHKSQVRTVAVSKNGKLIASGSSDNTIILYDAATYKTKAILEGHKSYVMSIAFSPDGTHLVSGSYDKTLKIWNLHTLECVSTLEGHTYLVNTVCYSNNGKKIASGSNDTTIKIWNTENFNNEAVLTGHTKWVFSAQFSPDDRHLASASGDRTLRLWNAQTYVCEATANLEAGDGSDVLAYSPSGLKIVTGGPNGVLKLWNAQTLVCEANLDAGHKNRIWSVAFSKSGNRVASGSSDITVKVWNMETLQCDATLKGHTESVMSVAFSPDGRQLVTGSQDNTVRVWTNN